MNKDIKYYKILKPNGIPCHGGSGVYHLPKSEGRKGKWMPKVKDVKCCRYGYHVCTIDQMTHWLKNGVEIWECEVRGENDVEKNKSSWEQIRLIKKVSWSDKKSRLFAADCAEHVLDLFEEKYPNDKRPREAIQASRDFANGKISKEQATDISISTDGSVMTAWPYSAAYAAYAAAAAASSSCYGSAHVNATADYAAAASASNNGRESERKWQGEKLKEYFYEISN